MIYPVNTLAKFLCKKASHLPPATPIYFIHINCETVHQYEEEKMIDFLKKHAQSIVITLIALVILYWEYELVGAHRWRVPSGVENSFFTAMGMWGIRFLLLSLLMSPLYAFTGWRLPLKLRKPLGLVAFLFVSVHAYIHLSAKFTDWGTYNLIQRLTSPYYIGFGAIAFGILALMAATSFKTT